jgi:alpha-beta hydrolase superfamily lysophospholipase
MKKNISILSYLKWAALAAVILLGGGLFFVYQVLPGKVAQALFTRSQTHKPLTQTPKEYDLDCYYEDVSFKTADGVTLSGWWIPARKAKKPLGTILLSHGVFKNREQVLTRALFLSHKGYQTLLFDQRGEGASGNSPVSGGLLEAGDYLAAAAYLQGRHALRKPVVFFGFSLGAISALRAAAQSQQADAVIADSPLANINSYVSRRTMGGVFSSLPGFLTRVLEAYNLLTGLSLKEGDLDLIPVVEGLHETPVLYITGEDDDLAKPEEVRKLFEHTSSHHRRLVYIPDAGHEETYKKYPMIYEKVVTDFLTDLRNGFPKSDDELGLTNGAGEKKAQVKIDHSTQP